MTCSYRKHSYVWQFGDGFWLILMMVGGGGQAASAGGRAGIGAVASYCQMPRKRSFGEAKSAAAPIPVLLANGD